MEGADSTVLTQAGEQLFVVKLLLTSVQCLWIYDYMLTVGDEVRYAWSGKKTWVFALFLANRYAPLVHLIWVHVTMFNYQKPLCQRTKWIPIFHSTIITLFSQTAVALRIYAITRRNRLLGGALALVIAAEMCNGIFSIVWVGLGPLEPLPEINLDAFKICIYKRWRLGELVYYNMAIFFDVLAFLIIAVTARRSRMFEYPTMPSILQIILRDATHHFVLIVSAHFLSTLFLFVLPASIQLMPGIANTIFVPVMASRLMLSLKRAAAEPQVVWSLGVMTNPSWGRTEEEATVRFAPRVPEGRHELSFFSAGRGEEDVELELTPRLLRN